MKLCVGGPILLVSKPQACQENIRRHAKQHNKGPCARLQLLERFISPRLPVYDQHCSGFDFSSNRRPILAADATPSEASAPLLVLQRRANARHRRTKIKLQHSLCTMTQVGWHNKTSKLPSFQHTRTHRRKKHYWVPITPERQGAQCVGISKPPKRLIFDHHVQGRNTPLSFFNNGAHS